MTVWDWHDRILHIYSWLVVMAVHIYAVYRVGRWYVRAMTGGYE